MDVQVEKTGSCLCKLSVSIPATDVETAFDKAWRKIGKQAQIPGFRPGKVPRSVVELHFRSQISQEVQNQLVEETLFRAIDDSQLAPVAYPRLQLGRLHRGETFSYTAEVEVRPEITLKAWEGLHILKLDADVPDEEVNAELESMRTEAAQLVPVLLRDDVQDKDVVQIDYEGFINGVPFAGGKADNALVEIGGEGYIPGFAEGLVGAKVPGDREIQVTFPEHYSSAEVAGKQATFKVRLKELKTRELPRLDDEFAKDMGESDLAALQAKVRGTLQKRKEGELYSARRAAVLKALVEANPFEVPPSLVQAQADRIVASAAARVERMTGQRLQFTEQQLANLRADSQSDAEFQVRGSLLLLEVAKVAKIEVSPQEVEQEIDAMAHAAGEHAERLRDFYDEPERREELSLRLLEDKAIELIMARSVEAPAAEHQIESPAAEHQAESPAAAAPSEA